MKIIEGKFYFQNEIKNLSIGIENGKIVKIAKSLTGEDKISITEGTIFPAMIDMHVHFREPGYTKKEDFESGSMSALHGGVTFYMDMPNTKPVTNSYDNFIDKFKLAKMKSYVDFGIAYLLHSKVEKKMENMVTAFKIYMSETTGIDPVNYLLLPEIAKGVKKHITVHAEFNECLKKNVEEKDLNDHDRSRPETCEVMAVRYLGDNFNGGFHIAHVSSPDSVELAKAFDFTAEVTPHHLFLNKELSLGALGKVNPPLRSKFVSEKLLNYLNSGLIEAVASDHSPHTIEEKDNFGIAPSGLPGVETSLPLLFQAYKDNLLSLETVTRVAMENPGKLLSIPKGKIVEGYDADFIVMRLSDSKVIRAKDLHYKCGWTPYENLYGIFPRTVFLRGEKVLDNFEETVEPGRGKYYPEIEI
ncbi:MAG: dihydroorotase [Thermoplasmata archaeon]